MQTLEQKRAAFAWQKVQAVKNMEGKTPAKVAMYLRRLPAMIMVNGLGQSLAFLLADAENHRDRPSYVTFDLLAEWLVDERKLFPQPRQHLFSQLVQGDRAQYQQAQEETWALLNWLKKLADAYLPSEGGGGN